MTTFALNNLWTYIESLHLSAGDRAWLASKLQEPSHVQLSAVPHARSKKHELKLTEFDRVKADRLREIESIPEEFRCDPFEMSPSGDPFYADSRNVDMLLAAQRESHEEAERGELIPMKQGETLEEFLSRME